MLPVYNYLISVVDAFIQEFIKVNLAEKTIFLSKNVHAFVFSVCHYFIKFQKQTDWKIKNWDKKIQKFHILLLIKKNKILPKNIHFNNTYNLQRCMEELKKNIDLKKLQQHWFDKTAFCHPS